MPFQIVKKDINDMPVDAIVRILDPEQDLWRMGSIEVGNAAIVPTFQRNAAYVIHAAAPHWLDGRHDEERLLRSCYARALALALEKGCRSVAFPPASGVPKDQALQAAISAISAFLQEQEMQIYLVAERDSCQLSDTLFRHVAGYIDDHYVERKGFLNANRHRPMMAMCESSASPEAAPMVAAKAMSLEELLKNADAGFTETLLKLIDQTGRKDSEIYKKANLSKQHFSKIRNNPDYRPTKQTAIALALALELSLEETRDLIGRAGYALTNSSKFDLIIRYFIEQGNYNVVEINVALYEFDQPLLGQ